MNIRVRPYLLGLFIVYFFKQFYFVRMFEFRVLKLKEKKICLWDDGLWVYLFISKYELSKI